MKTNKFLKTIERYSLHNLSRESDERIEGVLQKRMAALQSIQETQKYKRSFYVWKYMFSIVAAISVFILALNLSISKDQFYKSGIITAINSNSVDLAMMTNGSLQFCQPGRKIQSSPSLITMPMACERVSLNCWKMASN